MPRRVHYEIYFHINWHTKGSLPLIKADVEPVLYQYIKHKVIETPEAVCHAIGGIEDHIHLAVTLPPTVKPSEWIGIIKGSSSHHMNQVSNRKLLEWQKGYGIVSFGKKDLKWVVNYVENQKEHHRKGTTHDRLERTEGDDDG